MVNSQTRLHDIDASCTMWTDTLWHKRFQVVFKKYDLLDYNWATKGDLAGLYCLSNLIIVMAMNKLR